MLGTMGKKTRDLIQNFTQCFISTLCIAHSSDVRYSPNISSASLFVLFSEAVSIHAMTFCSKTSCCFSVSVSLIVSLPFLYIYMTHF